MLDPGAVAPKNVDTSSSNVSLVYCCLFSDLLIHGFAVGRLSECVLRAPCLIL